jgi:3-dehydroquinate dehydratase type I
LTSPRICVPVTARSPSQAVDVIRSVQPYAPDLMELRFDYMESPGSLQRIRDSTSLPLIATNRRRDQGGLSSHPEADRVTLLLEACEAGFDYVDLELTTSSINEVSDEVKSRGAMLIISYHDLNGTPPRKALNQIVREELSAGADICKVVGTSKSLHDNLLYLSLLEENPDINLICFGMGEAGVMSRVFSPLFGGAFTYASAGIGMESAPGQLTIADLKGVYRLLGV